MNTKQTAVIDLMAARTGGHMWWLKSLNGSQNDVEWSGSDILDEMTAGDRQALSEAVAKAAKAHDWGGVSRRLVTVTF